MAKIAGGSEGARGRLRAGVGARDSGRAAKSKSVDDKTSWSKSCRSAGSKRRGQLLRISLHSADPQDSVRKV